MSQAATSSARSRRRAGGIRLRWICGAFVVLQIIVVTVMPPRARGVTAGLLTVLSIVAVLVMALEASFKRAAERAAAASTRVTEPSRRTRERGSPHMQRAYYMARNGESASHIARSCEIPEAFAVLIVDEVRRAGSRKGPTARN
jgi:hypothetical protein